MFPFRPLYGSCHYCSSFTGSVCAGKWRIHDGRILFTRKKHTGSCQYTKARCIVAESWLSPILVEVIAESLVREDLNSQIVGFFQRQIEFLLSFVAQPFQ